MPLTAAKARALGVELDEDIDALVDAFDADLLQIWLRLRERIIELTNRLTTKDGQVVANQVNLGIARAVAREMEAMLAEAGYAHLVRDALEEIGELGKYAGFGQRLVAQVEASVTWSAEALDAFYALRSAELMEVPREMVRQFEQILFRGVVGASDRGALINELLHLMDVKQPVARTIYDTAVTQFSQMAILSTSTGAPDETFLYNGPIDARIRPFCLDRVGKVYTRAQIREMDNGQQEDVLITRGGYNCRHKWIPIPAENEMAAKVGDYADEEYAKSVQFARAAQRSNRLRGGRGR